MSERDKKSVDISGLSFRQLLALDACMRCGECKVWCPVVAEDAREELTPRAKARAFRRMINEHYGALGDEGFIARCLGPATREILRKIFRTRPMSEEDLTIFKSSLYECSTCGQCAVVCPAGIETVELWERIRRAMVEAGQGPMESQQRLIESIIQNDNPWQQPKSTRDKWARKASRSKEIKAAPMELKTPGQARVLYFVGCTASFDQNIRDVAVNTVKILEAARVEFGIMGNSERCCASVMKRIGVGLFEEIAADNIRAFNGLGIETLVTSCSGCFKTIRDDYPRLAPLNFEVLHITEFITRLLAQGKLKLTHPVEKKVTYHDPCHLGRATHVYDAPREVLRAIPGVELIEMERSREYARCCGAGGGLKSGFMAVQQKLSDARVRDALTTRATDFVTACPFCYQSLKEAIARTRAPLNMMEITELVCKAIE